MHTASHSPTPSSASEIGNAGAQALANALKTNANLTNVTLTGKHNFSILVFVSKPLSPLSFAINTHSSQAQLT